MDKFETLYADPTSKIRTLFYEMGGAGDFED
jgi:hypothetical protein